MLTKLDCFILKYRTNVRNESALQNLLNVRVLFNNFRKSDIGSMISIISSKAEMNYRKNYKQNAKLNKLRRFDVYKAR